MKTLSILSGFCLISVYAASSLLPEFAPKNQKFSADVYQELQRKEHGNFMVCPLSLQIIMALVAAGAKGETAAEIRKALRFTGNQSEVNLVFSEFMPMLRSTNNYNLTSANRIFVKDSETFNISNDYRNLATRDYRSGIENLNFEENVQSAKAINKWVEQQTNNKIRNLISPNDITSDLALILVNTIYFNANWSTQFKSLPGLQKFYTDKHQTVNVKMMSLTGTFNYYDSQDLDCQLLELPYVGYEFSMIIALPKERGRLSSLEERIGDIFSHTKFQSERVLVQIPEFSVETSIKFTEILLNMGIKKAFTDDADFSGIAPNLKISKVVQKTFINVTESGTEAAAATAGFALTLAIPVAEPASKIFFKANHPFLFSIMYSSHRTILFTGCVVTF